jgi:hypothetical protein
MGRLTLRITDMKVLSMRISKCDKFFDSPNQYVASQSSADEADPLLRPLTAGVGRVRNDSRAFKYITYWALTLPGRTNRIEE